MNPIPREAREGLTRAWLEILRERHPEMSWVQLEDSPLEDGLTADQTEAEIGAATTVAVP